jgi:hypothetical protein
MDNQPRILVGTLFCGENEFGALKQSLSEQTYPHWKHVVYKNLPNKEAHDRLYRTFMEEQGDFDLFLKLDADMVFRTDEGLERIVRIFEEDPDLDHLTLAVWDWYSDSLIEGLHTFSDRARWETGEESRFVDPSPLIRGKRQKLWTDPAPVVDHSPDPSPFQAFRFGVHRALKVVQRDRWIMRFRQAMGQWTLLRNCWKHFEKEGDRRLGLALLGAEEVFRDRAEGAEYDRDQELLKKRLKRCENLNGNEIRQLLRQRWNGESNAKIGAAKIAGRVRTGVSYAYYIGHKIRQSEWFQ